MKLTAPPGSARTSPAVTPPQGATANGADSRWYGGRRRAGPGRHRRRRSGTCRPAPGRRQHGRREGVEGLEGRRPAPLVGAGPGVDGAGRAGGQGDHRRHLAALVGVGAPSAVAARRSTRTVGLSTARAPAPPRERGRREAGDVRRLRERRRRADVGGQGGVPRVVARRTTPGRWPRRAAACRGLVDAGDRIERGRPASAGPPSQGAGQAHEVGVHVVGGVRAVARERLAVVVAGHVLAVRDRVAVVVRRCARARSAGAKPVRRATARVRVKLPLMAAGSAGSAPAVRTLAGSSQPAASLWTCARMRATRSAGTWLEPPIGQVDVAGPPGCSGRPVEAVVRCCRPRRRGGTRG